MASGRVSRIFEGECPQGSTPGPTPWLVGMNWLEEKMEGVDHQVVLVAGMSVKKIEEKCQESWEVCREWERKERIRYEGENGRSENPV